jgi:hypothetical protein
MSCPSAISSAGSACGAGASAVHGSSAASSAGAVRSVLEAAHRLLRGLAGAFVVEIAATFARERFGACAGRLIRFDITAAGADGTDLCWTMYVAEPLPDNALIGHMRKRVNQLINANLRYTFGQ